MLVTGAAGFVGAHVVRSLLAGGHNVAALVRPQTDPQRLSGLGSAIRLLPLALEDVTAVSEALRAQRPEAVIHLAWYAQPDDYLSSARNLESLAATLSFVQAVVASECPRLVGVGTCLEYADLPRPREEHDLTDPQSLYAACKLSAQSVTRALTRGTHTRFAWARLFHLYGPGEHPRRVLPSVVAALRAGRPIALSGCSQLRDHLRVEDAAAALVRLASGEPVEGVFNVCSGQPRSLRALLEAVADRMGGRELLRFGERPAAPGEPAVLVGVPDALRALGWTRRFDEHTGLDYLSEPSV